MRFTDIFLAGADTEYELLPFGDPRRAHGTPFEGYYWRLTDAAGD